MNATRVRRHFSKYILLILTAITAGITPACIDDMIWREDPNSGDGIRFNVDVDGSWQKPRSITRSNGEPVDSMFEKLVAGPSHTIRPMDGTVGGKAVYLHEIVDSWDTGMSKSLSTGSNSQPQTRGTVVAGEEHPMYPEFGVSAYHHEESWPAAPAYGAWWGAGFTKYGYFLEPNLFNNLSARGADGNYGISPAAFWPEKGNAHLLAWAPKDNSNYKFHSENWGLGPCMEVTVPDAIADQKDLLVAMTDEMNVADISGAVDLKFKHAMTGIRISIADDMVKCVIEEVKFTNISSHARMFFSYTWSRNGVPEWSHDTPPITKDFTITPNMPINGPREDLYENRYVDGGNLSEMFIMLPQTLPADAQIIVRIRQIHADGTPAAESENISANLGGKYWGPGQIVTYRLSYNGWWNGVYFKDRSNSVNSVITANFEGVFDEGNPDEDNYSIDLPYISYNVTNQNVGQRNVDCRLEFNYTDENGVYSGWKRLPPAWLSLDESLCKTVARASIPDSYYTGEGCEDYSKKFKFYIDQQTQDTRINWSVDDILYKTPSVGSKENPYNLSNPNGAFGAGYSDSGNSTLYKNTGIHTTANCYMIAAPGWYILPCVYGNAITKSQDNVDAYDPARNNASVRDAGAGVLKTFVNHLGNGITHPIIKKNAGCANPTKAEFVWSDTKVMVENIEYVPDAFSGVGGIRFHISTGDNLAVNPEFKAGINQGNCVIALKDASGANMWSWHIWVNPIPTNRKSLTEIQNKAGDRYKMMAVNLGWISTGELMVFRQRSCLVRMTNENVWDSKKSDPAIVEFFQREHVSYWHGYSPYWQWGRKDPFIPGAYEHTSVAWWQPAENDLTGHGGNMWWGPYPMDSKEAKAKFGNEYEFGAGLSGLKKRVLHPNIWHHDDYFKDYLYDTDGNPVLDAEGNHKYTERSEDNTFFNLWSAKRTGAWNRPPVGQIATAPPNNYVVKTVYDPCPPGYKVPPLDVFTGITITGDNSSEGSGDQKYYNGVHQTYSATIPWLKIENNQNGEKGFLWKSPFSLNIYKFFADRAHKYTVAFPMSGYRYFVGATLTEIGTDGYYWTAESSSRNRAYYMCYSKGRGVNHVMPLNEYYHLDGMSIRPILDNDSWEGDQSTTQDSWSRFFDDALWQQGPFPTRINEDDLDYQAVDWGSGIIEMTSSVQAMKQMKSANKRENTRRSSRQTEPARKNREYNAGDIQRRVSRFLPGVFRDRR